MVATVVLLMVPNLDELILKPYAFSTKACTLRGGSLCLDPATLSVPLEHSVTGEGCVQTFLGRYLGVRRSHRHPLDLRTRQSLIPLSTYSYLGLIPGDLERTEYVLQLIDGALLILALPFSSYR